MKAELHYDDNIDPILHGLNNTMVEYVNFLANPDRESFLLFTRSINLGTGR